MKAVKRGYSLVAVMMVVTALTAVYLSLCAALVAEVEKTALAEEFRLEADAIARACLSRAFARYIAGLRQFPHLFYVGQGTCVFISAEESTKQSGMEVLLKVEGHVASGRSIIEAVFNTDSLTLISYSFK